MNKIILLLFFLCNAAFAQSIIGHNNSGSMVTASYSATVGEIYVVPQNTNNASAGTLAAATQVVLHSLGIKDYAVVNGITYYPNPVQDYLTVDLNQVADLSKVQLYDVKGTLVALPPANGNMLNLSSLAAGVYFMSFSNTAVKPVKIVKN
jgi:hypothetical protein